MIHSSELDIVNTKAEEVEELQKFIFDEQGFIDSTRQNVQSLHGVINSNDEELIRQLAAHTRTFRFTDLYLANKSMVVIQKSNGLVAHPYVNIRYQASMACAKLMQILKIDMASRKPTTQSAEADNYFDFAKGSAKPKEKVKAN